MGHKHKIHAAAKAANTSGPHDVGRPWWRPPPCGDSSCGPLVFPAFAFACVFCFCPILYFMFLPHIVFSSVCFTSLLVMQIALKVGVKALWTINEHIEKLNESVQQFVSRFLRFRFKTFKTYRCLNASVLFFASYVHMGVMSPALRE